MAKQVTSEIKIQLAAGKATPAPPVGTALGPVGINIMDFCKQFNDQTKDKGDMVIPVVISVYADKTFSFIMKTPPAAVLIKKVIGLSSGSAAPNKDKVGKITDAQVEEIAKTKLPDLNAYSIEAAKKVIAGTARSMGVLVEG